ncbi:type II toxin-antitoxin system PemK/MazF family toxin [Alicyclobacillus sendaiensis]|uniref:type II toxin-antitoxin system PemK/MazF family toxin n=1 Tax=Alicyclobacillus sendaiensis TaxID=192387 RepID=UPI0026F4643D|nr:type II toxin-antitoxin system PemK/MazF family toxin [Alicyclobacillus sendaiensis]
MVFRYVRHAQAIRWFALQTKINDKYDGSIGHFFPRGSVVNVFFGENVGFEKTGTRPAVVISNDTINKTSGNIIVAPLTDVANKAGKKMLSTQYILRKSNNPFLKMDSIVQCEDMRVVSKARVGDLIGFIHPSDKANLDKRIKACFFGP